ncbi:uncharacterized protein LOC102803175, partial [Saccoglossus kowalevskii]
IKTDEAERPVLTLQQNLIPFQTSRNITDIKMAECYIGTKMASQEVESDKEVKDDSEKKMVMLFGIEKELMNDDDTECVSDQDIEESDVEQTNNGGENVETDMLGQRSDIRASKVKIFTPSNERRRRPRMKAEPVVEIEKTEMLNLRGAQKRKASLKRAQREKQLVDEEALNEPEIETPKRKRRRKTSGKIRGKKHLCDVCQKVFKDKWHLQRHMFTHSDEKPFSCEACGKNFKSPVNLREHQLIHQDKLIFICEVCSKGFATKHQLDWHVKKYHTKAKGHRCEICDQHFSRNTALRVHKEVHATEEEKQFPCQICGERFAFVAGYCMHQKTQHGAKTYACPVCGKTSSVMLSLETHVSVHTGEKRYQCDVCGKGYISEGGLKWHQSTHAAERPFKCTECTAAFYTKYDLQKHTLVHSDNKQFVCETCGSQFKMKSHLAEHQKRHTGELMKKYTCQECGSGFYTQSHLSRHLAIHTGIKPYACNVCGKKYSRQDNLRVHMKTHGITVKPKMPKYKTRPKITTTIHAESEVSSIRDNSSTKSSQSMNAAKDEQLTSVQNIVPNVASTVASDEQRTGSSVYTGRPDISATVEKHETSKDEPLAQTERSDTRHDISGTLEKLDMTQNVSGAVAEVERHDHISTEKTTQDQRRSSVGQDHMQRSIEQDARHSVGSGRTIDSGVLHNLEMPSHSTKGGQDRRQSVTSPINLPISDTRPLSGQDRRHSVTSPINPSDSSKIVHIDETASLRHGTPSYNEATKNMQTEKRYSELHEVGKHSYSGIIESDARNRYPEMSGTDTTKRYPELHSAEMETRYSERLTPHIAYSDHVTPPQTSGYLRHPITHGPVPDEFYRRQLTHSLSTNQNTGHSLPTNQNVGHSMQANQNAGHSLSANQNTAQAYQEQVEYQRNHMYNQMYRNIANDPNVVSVASETLRNLQWS